MVALLARQFGPLGFLGTVEMNARHFEVLVLFLVSAFINKRARLLQSLVF